MFDNAPQNLPFEPTPPSVPKSPMGAMPSALPEQMPSVPKAQGGIFVGQKKEPEDILSDTESVDDARASDVVEALDDAPKSKGGFRMIVIVLAAVAAVLVLAVGGIFLYQRFMAPPAAEEIEPTGTGIEAPESESPSVPAVIPSEEPVMEAPEAEAPPAVPETPPSAIPQPQPVGQSLDTDGDGLTDIRETEFGTDIQSSDTDGDGLADGREVEMKTDPLVADTDGDGLTDGDEISLWLTSPLTVDTDGDSYPDGSEVKNGYNPNGEGRLPGMR
jgi:hypothetical protein